MGAPPLSRVTTSDVEAEGLADWVAAAEDESGGLGLGLVLVSGGLVVGVAGGVELGGGLVLVPPVPPVLVPVEPPVGLGDPEPVPVGLGLGEVAASHFETEAPFAADV